MDKATEMEWLQWFYANCDFGPAHSDVVEIMKENFTTETGKALPVGYADEE